MNLQGSVKKIKVFIVSEGSKMVKSEKNKLKFKKLEFKKSASVCAAWNLWKTHFSLWRLCDSVSVQASLTGTHSEKIILGMKNT